MNKKEEKAVVNIYAKNCTFIDKQIVEKQNVENMTVQSQHAGCADGMLQSELASYILDENLLARVTNACHHCKNTKDVAERIIFLLRQSEIWNKEIMTRESFFESLIPHINFDTNGNAIYQSYLRTLGKP